MPEVQVLTTYLQTTTPPIQPHPRLSDDPALYLLHVTACPPYVYRDLYRTIGRSYNWHARYHWTDTQIAANLADPATSFHILYRHHAPAGFFELRRHPAPDDDSVEIVYLGLLPSHTGRRLGHHLVASALHHAWTLRPTRVWLHTCSLDHPAALPTYRAAGLVPYQTLPSVEPVLKP